MSSGIATWRPFMRPSLRTEPPATNIWLVPVTQVPEQLQTSSSLKSQQRMSKQTQTNERTTEY